MVQRVKMTTIEQTTATETMEVVQVILHTQQTKVRYSVTECVLCISSLPRYFHHFFPSNPIQHSSSTKILPIEFESKMDWISGYFFWHFFHYYLLEGHRSACFYLIESLSSGSC